VLNIFRRALVAHIAVNYFKGERPEGRFPHGRFIKN